MKKAILILLAVILVGTIGFKVKQKLDHQSAIKTQSLNSRNRSELSTTLVKVLKLTRQPLSETIKVVGEVITETEIAVQPRINGRLLQLLVDEGQPVAAGQLLAVMDDESLQLQIQQAQSNVASAKANLRQAQLNLDLAKTEKERYQELLAKKYISQKDYESVEKSFLTAETSAEISKEQLSNAQKNLELLKIQLNQTRIHSPCAGYVLKKHVTTGTNLTTGTEILTIAPLDRVKVKFNIDQKEAAKIRKGMTAGFIADTYPEEIFKGAVQQTAPVYDPQTRSLSCTINITNRPLKLFPGMFGTVEIYIGGNQQALVVPEEALVQQGANTGVFIVTENEEALFQTVTIGIVSEGMAEITSGLQEGDPVIVVGQNRLRDGQKVQILTNDPAEKRRSQAEPKKNQPISPLTNANRTGRKVPKGEFNRFLH